MTRMTGPDCAVMCNLLNTHTHTMRTGAGTSTKTEREGKRVERPGTHQIMMEVGEGVTPTDYQQL